MSVILSPVGPYFKSGLQAISLYIDDGNVRAWPGGVGQFKIGGNYAPTIVPQVRAARRAEGPASAMHAPSSAMHALQGYSAAKATAFLQQQPELRGLCACSTSAAAPTQPSPQHGTPSQQARQQLTLPCLPL